MGREKKYRPTIYIYICKKKVGQQQHTRKLTTILFAYLGCILRLDRTPKCVRNRNMGCIPNRWPRQCRSDRPCNDRSAGLKKREREKIQPPRRERERKKVGDPTLDVLLAIAVSILRVTIRFVVDTSLREAPTVVTAQTAEIPEVGLALVTFGARHAWLALALSLG